MKDNKAVEHIRRHIREKIDKLKAERERIKAYNELCQLNKGTPAERMTELEPEQVDELLMLARVAPLQLGGNGAFPGYKLEGLEAEIRRLEAKIKEIKGVTS